MSLSQIELVWVRVEWECFWVNQREDNKVSESKMAVAELIIGSIQDGCYHQVVSEWMSEVFFVQIVGTNLGKCEWVWEEILWWLNKLAKFKMIEFKMAAIITLSENELVWVRLK